MILKHDINVRHSVAMTIAMAIFNNMRYVLYLCVCVFKYIYI